MDNEIIFDNVKFWLDQDIIHCNFYGKIDKGFLDFEIEHIFTEVISSFSTDNFKPILIDLTEVSNMDAFRLYKTISRNFHIKSYVISKLFLVKSVNIKLLLKLSNIGNNKVIPIKISTCVINAIQFSNKKYTEFNATN